MTAMKFRNRWIAQDSDLESSVRSFVFDNHWSPVYDVAMRSEQNDLHTEIEGPIILMANGILQMISDMMYDEYDV